MSKCLIKLYITGQTPRSRRAVENLRRLGEEVGSSYELEVIDVLKQPQLAEDQKILVTPTVVKELPTPIRRLIGDLSDTEKVLLGLELVPDRRAISNQQSVPSSQDSGDLIADS